jgi:MFS family permease
MNLSRIALAALAAFVAYFIVGGIFFIVPAIGAEFANYSSIYRTGDSATSVMAVGMLGIFIAIVVAAAIFARLHPAGAGIKSGIKFGLALAVFQLGSFVLHNHMMLNIGWRLSMLQGIVYTAEWIVVGVVISLVYRG